MRTALFPGTFDPVHFGHLEVLDGARRVFDHVIIAAFNNTKSKPLFTLEERAAMLREAVGDRQHVEVTSSSSLVADLARERNVAAIVRGLRAVSDFESELQIAQMNHHLSGIQTVFIPTSANSSFLASRLIREVALFGGDVASLVPPTVVRHFAQRLPSAD